jgi:hypothetical protein
VIHLVNYGGSLTMPLEFAPPPLADVAVDVCPPAGMAVVGVRALVSGRQLDVRCGGESGGAGGATVVVPRLRVYEALVVDVRRRG